jgi:hypothetical protein
MPHSFVLRLRDLMIEQETERHRQTELLMKKQVPNGNNGNSPIGLDESSLREAVEDFI